MVITLIGYRGAGKSTIGPALAARLSWDFVDADPEIERRAGRTIREIFASGGEAAFRTLEAESLAEFLARDRLVLAPGGGAVLNAQTRERMRTAGPVVWLTAPIDLILERMQNDPTTGQRRPSLTGLPPRKEIEQLLAQREPLYADAATIRLDTAGRDVNSLVDEICRRLSLGEISSAEAGR